MGIAFVVTLGEKEFSDMDAAFRNVAPSLLSAMNSAAGGIKAALMSSLREVAGRMAERHGNPWPGMLDGSSRTLFSRTGGGLRTILESPVVMGGPSLDDIVGRISAGDLSWHENAANPAPRNARYMTIPLPAALDSRGVPIYPTARAWAGTFVMRSKRGNLIIFQRRGRTLVPLYLLKAMAPRPPRLGMEDAILDEMGYFEMKVVEQIDAAMERWRI